MSQKNKEVSLDHINLTVANLAESIAWYREVFDFQVVEKGVTPLGRVWSILRSGDSILCVYEEGNRKNVVKNNPDLERFHRVYHFAFRMKDRAQWEKTLKDLNLETYYDSPVVYPFSTSWYVQDPSGHEIEVVFWNEEQVQFKNWSTTLSVNFRPDVG